MSGHISRISEVILLAITVVSFRSRFHPIVKNNDVSVTFIAFIIAFPVQSWQGSPFLTLGSVMKIVQYKYKYAVTK
jgi:hypothetical protein